MKVIQLFLWLLAPLAVWWVIGSMGTPHLVVSYQFYDNGDRYNPHAPRVYISCTYVGWTGLTRVPAMDGDCPWVLFLRSQP